MVSHALHDVGIDVPDVLPDLLEYLFVVDGDGVELVAKEVANHPPDQLHLFMHEGGVASRTRPSA